MKSLFVRLVLTSIAVFALIYGCSDVSDSPTQPTSNLLVYVAATGDCGAADYLTALSPVLAEWQDSLTSVFVGPFDDAPTFTEGSNVEVYLGELAPVLQQWELTINTEMDSAVVDTVPSFDPASDSTPEYLVGLSDLLQQWKSALDEGAGRELLAAPPVFAGDTAAPEIICPADTTIGCADTSGVTVDFADLIEVSDDCDPSPEVACDPPSGSIFPLGETIVTCTATDSVGNETECTFTVTVDAAEPPVITCPEDTTVECTGPDGAVVEFSPTATSECDDSLTVVCDPESGSVFPHGETVVTCTATDSLGNSAECSFTVSVVDNTPPVIVCPSDTTLECAGDGGTMLEFEVTASDICDETPTVECDPPSGSVFPLGQTVVTCTATDAAGNSSQCTFTVTVEDTTPPVINDVTLSHEVLWPPNHKMVEVFVSVDATDVCDSELSCYIYDVTSNEEINGRGDGNTEPDWIVTGDLTVKLRSERAGIGDGRSYYVHIRCEDSSGNSAEHTAEVRVPHDRRSERVSF